MLFVISGKQVKILYEPVAVWRFSLPSCPVAAYRGQAIGFPLRRRTANLSRVEISGSTLPITGREAGRGRKSNKERCKNEA